MRGLRWTEWWKSVKKVGREQSIKQRDLVEVLVAVVLMVTHDRLACSSSVVYFRHRQKQWINKCICAFWEDKCWGFLSQQKSNHSTNDKRATFQLSQASILSQHCTGISQHRCVWGLFLEEIWALCVNKAFNQKCELSLSSSIWAVFGPPPPSSPHPTITTTPNLRRVKATK